LPENFNISILKDADLYSRKEYFAKLEQGKAQAEEAYKTWDETKKISYSKMAKLNIKWDGQENWQDLSDKARQEKIYQAALYETSAITTLDKVVSTVKSPENILVFTKATPEFIGIGSAKNSVAKNWVGFGVFETNAKGVLQPRILTTSQYSEALKQPHQKISCHVIPGKNFKEILVFDQPFDFRG